MSVAVDDLALVRPKGHWREWRANRNKPPEDNEQLHRPPPETTGNQDGAENNAPPGGRPQEKTPFRILHPTEQNF